MSGCLIVVTGRVPYPDGSLRIMFECAAGDCVEGHVEARPPSVAEAVLEKLAGEHNGAGLLLGGLIEVGPR